MTIAEFFVNIGIKGDGKAKEALASVKTGLKDISETGLAAKAAILAIFYGIEKFTGAAGKRGMELDQFSRFTGLAAANLQKLQYAMSLSGVEADETQQTIQNLQSAMMKLSIGKAAPEYMDLMTRVLGKGFDKNKLKDTFYVFDQVTNYIKKEKNLALANEAAASFGFSPKMLAATRASRVDYHKVDSSKILGNDDIGRLQKMNTAWVDLINTLNIFFQKFEGRHGMEIIQTFERLAVVMFKLAEALEKFAAFTGILKQFSNILGMAGDNAEAIAEGVEGVQGKNPVKDTAKAFGKFLLNNAKRMSVPFMAYEALKHPSLSSAAKGGAKKEGNNTTINQNIIHHGDAKDTKAVKELHKHSVKGAFYQMQAKNVVT